MRAAVFLYSLGAVSLSSHSRKNCYRLQEIKVLTRSNKILCGKNREPSNEMYCVLYYCQNRTKTE